MVKCSLQKHFHSNTAIFFFPLIHDTVNPSLESKMFQSVICILGSPKHEYLLPTVCMINGQLMTCCKRSYIMRLCVCLGNSEPFPLTLLSMIFILVVIPFYLSLTHLFLFRKSDCILLESQLVYTASFFLDCLFCSLLFPTLSTPWHTKYQRTTPALWTAHQTWDGLRHLFPCFWCVV